MIPENPLPLPPGWPDVDTYVKSLLDFTTSSELFGDLCGGVHILDFLTREPDLYTSLIPQDWRDFFDKHDLQDILDLLLREDIDLLCHNVQSEDELAHATGEASWRGGPMPPSTLVEYIRDIRRHSLAREFIPKTVQGDKRNPAIPHHICVGMNPKKYHEVQNFSHFVDSLVANVDEERKEPITHIVDFGSGQNYLGRTLASPPYNKQIIAVERKHQYISGAKGMDIRAKLQQETIEVGGKKQSRSSKQKVTEPESRGSDTPVSITSSSGSSEVPYADTTATAVHIASETNMTSPKDDGKAASLKNDTGKEVFSGSMDYIEHEIQDGYLEPIIKHVVSPESEDTKSNPSEEKPQEDSRLSNGPRVMVVSLHSCGNLVHHGIRSLILNPSVAAVAMIGCCYNLMTERLGPVTYKLGSLRSPHPRIEKLSNAYDPHGFPMSRSLEKYAYNSESGIKLNITARMMAVQAPCNWGPADSEGFFTRHFFRALLQRIFVDCGVVPVPGTMGNKKTSDGSYREVRGTPLIVGSLRKAAYTSFQSYARTAMTKLTRDPDYGESIKEASASLSDEQLDRYVADYSPAKKNLSIVWSLMAFSAGVVESLIVTDRWLFLREHDCVKTAWVETAFDYSQSPRNLVVIGVKK